MPLMSNLPLPTRFNVRVYGLLVHENKVLIAHEKIGDFAFTKFPGGGLEFGEGLLDGLIREFKEEANLDITIKSHFYTTDFFQQSAFKPQDQLLSVYYWVEAKDLSGLVLNEQLLNTGNRTEQLRLEWKTIDNLSAEIFTFPIDKLVAEKIKQLV